MISTTCACKLGDSPAQNLRRRGPEYSTPHDTTQTRANWTGNPAASSALADSRAAHACDARAQRRLNAPDDLPPWSCDWHTAHAYRSAPSEDRHPIQGNKRCPARQPNHPLRLARYACDPPPPHYVWWRQFPFVATVRWLPPSHAVWGRWIARVACETEGVVRLLC